jgi:hypothetical protein
VLFCHICDKDENKAWHQSEISCEIRKKKTPTELKRQSVLWKTPTSQRMKKARMSKSQVKVMVIVFFNIRGVIMIEWVPEGQTFNQKTVWRS